MTSPEAGFEALRVILCLFWITISAAVLGKRFVPALERGLNYGKLSHAPVAHDDSRYTGNRLRAATHQGINRVVAVLTAPAVLAPRHAWTCFYVVGIFMGFICVKAFVHLRGSPPPLVLLLFMLQVTRRLGECLFVHRFSTGPNLSLLLWLAAVSFYVAAPLTLFVDSLGLRMQSGPTSGFWTVLACVYFLVASSVQHVAHRTLAEARPVVGKYGIPRGRLFDRVACPHYTAEIAIYTLFAMETRQICSVLMLAFVLINLADSGARTMSWYRTKFPRELLPPRQNHALFPFGF